MIERTTAGRPRYEQDREVFLARAVTLSTAVRVALDAVVTDSSGVRAMGRTLGIDKSLASKVMRIARASDSIEVFAVLPGTQGWTRFCAALAEVGLDDARLTAVRDAIDLLESEMASRGVSRDRVRSWAETDRPAGGSAESSRCRSELTQANAAVWGIGGEALLRSHIAVAAGDPTRHGTGTATTIHGLHRTRPGPDWPIHRCLADAGEMRDEVAIDCRDLCSEQGRLETGVLENLNGSFRVFRGRESGPSNRVDMVFAELHSEASRPPTEFQTTMLVPTAVAVFDLLLTGSVPLEPPPRFWSSSEIGGVPRRASLGSAGHLAMSERLEGPTRVSTLDDLVPSADLVSSDAREAHGLAVQRTLERLGAEVTHLVRYRLVVPHPVMSSSVHLAFEPPGNPED